MNNTLQSAKSYNRIINRSTNRVVVILLTIYSALTVYPLLWLLISAFKTDQEFFLRPFGLPEHWMGENLRRAWSVGHMGQGFLNSIIVTSISLLLTLLVGSLGAYIVARFRFKLKPVVMGMFMIGMLIPIHSTLVPLFILMKQMHILNSYGALLFPYTAFALPTTIFIISAFMSSIPRDLEEAAMMDGNGLWGIFWRVMLPVSRPALATTGILSFLQFWNDYAFALIFISNNALKTLPLSLSIFTTGYSTNYGLTMAAIAIAAIPTILIYLLLQEQVMKGMTAGAVKG
ncbi:carbohydrate ABC transporter permease [Cohnella silvisoli]|uniref:Carbohydrate ABC transporter permease n=1 Tax=Cohnella silvisoli TaxID=2873699 RepID=A0ABV1L2C6_9BACL|nr:carbohydrate ABC transporter permease [Cohnella silvisoli]MCD9025789.1 carbohydrate ABC transporter permease [Cohnella silvisoli]